MAVDDPTVSLQIIRRRRSDLDTIRSDAATILTGTDRPTAVIGLYDELALIVMQEAARLGISIPGELSVIGLDNLDGGEPRQPRPFHLRSGRAWQRADNCRDDAACHE